MHFKLTFFVFFIAVYIDRHAETALTLEQMNQTMGGLRAACQPRFNVDNSTVDDIKKGNFPNNTDLKCYVNCVLEMMNLVRRGKLNYDSAVKQINLFMPDGMKEVYLGGVDKCRYSGDGIRDSCDYSYAMLQCFYKSSPVFMFP